MNTNLEEYLGQIEGGLRPLDPARRAELLLELRIHLEDSLTQLAQKEPSEDKRTQNALTRMGPPDEIAQALVEANHARSSRSLLPALFPFLFLTAAAVLDFHTSNNHSFITVGLLVGAAVSIYFWRQPMWPIWTAVWAGFACMIPLALTENGQTGGAGGLFLITLVFPLAALNFFRRQSGMHAALFTGGVLWVAAFVVLRAGRFSPELGGLGILPVMALGYFIRRTKRPRESPRIFIH